MRWIGNLATLLALFAVTAFSSLAGAATLNVGGTFQNGPLYVTLTGYNSGNSFQTSSGAITPNTLNGTPIGDLYCVEILTHIDVPGSYNADVSTAGIVHGGLIANAGAIAWLMDTYASTAVTQDQQEGLQAAIWQEVFGGNFSVDSVNTGAGIYSNYLADLAALGSNTAPLSDVLWLSPYNGDASPAQGLITLNVAGPNVPEPSTVVLAGLGLVTLGFAACRKKYRRT